MSQQEYTLKHIVSVFYELSSEERKHYDINEKTVYDMINNLDANCYYLGGQLKLSYNDKLSKEVFDRVHEINRKRDLEYGPANSFEMASIRKSKKELIDTEWLFRIYDELMNKRKNENEDASSSSSSNQV